MDLWGPNIPCDTMWLWNTRERPTDRRTACPGLALDTPVSDAVAYALCKMVRAEEGDLALTGDSANVKYVFL